MTAVTVLPQSRPLTRADLDAMPDDGHRYELINGALIVTPAPRRVHQRAVLKLGHLLDAACPEDLEVLPAPFDVALAADTVLQPDLLVARRRDLTDRDLPAAPLLVVEVLSPSTRLIDLNLKRARYEQAGCVSYWVIDTDVPEIVVWELREAGYVEVARTTDDQSCSLTAPFPVTIVPSGLVD